MFRYILVAALVATVAAAPAPEPKPAPKPLSLISTLKTPASTAKLTPIAAPIASPLIAPISHITYSAPALPHIAPYAYTYSAPLLAAAPASYSIEQHGYNIVY
ncbi:cyclin-dependent kinase inhibitor 1C-like [Venturia canescens]|uniref:cyclin-dependent kinase inhibitor 1C-like n=1 Tax=Venturia canescens TaxID=32260 RepID=UPI001C9CD524|nr:cyclin-dependent kinase inhibitor 1C-like [Venturia canescens]